MPSHSGDQGGESLYVAPSLRSQELAIPGEKPAALWIVAEPGVDAVSGYELACLLTPVLYRAIEGQVDEMAAAHAAGRLPEDTAVVAGERWSRIVEWAAEAGWLAAGGAVSRVTPAEVEAYQPPPAPCYLRELDEADAAVRELDAAERKREARAGDGEGDGGAAWGGGGRDPGFTPEVEEEEVRRHVPISYSKPKAKPSKAAGVKAEREAKAARRAAEAGPGLFGGG